MKKLTTVLAVIVAVTAAVTAQDKPAAAKAAATYVGAEKCKMCHKAQFAAWSESKHAKAWDALKPEEQTKAECVTCHQTGMTAEKAQLNGVQCEACHGAGSEYKKPTIMSAAKFKADKVAQLKVAVEAGLVIPTEATCVKCHKKEGNPNFKEFNFEKMKLLVHPVKAAAPEKK